MSYGAISAPATPELFELFQEYYKRLEAACNAGEQVACAVIPEALKLYQAGYVGAGLPYWVELGMKAYEVGLEGMRESVERAMPEPTIGGYEVESQGGYNFAIVRNSEGDIIDIRSLGQAEVDGGLSTWQQAQLANWNQEFQLQQQQLQMQQQQAMMPYGQMTAYQKAQMGLAEQAQWAETMSMPPSGWIEQWYRMQGGQPSYSCAPKSSPKCRDMSWGEYQRKLKKTQEIATGAIEGWERGQSLPGLKEMPLPGNWIYPTPGQARPGAITSTITEPGIMPMTRGMGGYPQAAQYAGQWIDPNSGTIAPKSEFSRPAGIGYQPISFPGALSREDLVPLMNYFSGASPEAARQRGTLVEPESGSRFVPMVRGMGAAPQAAEYKETYIDPSTGAKVTITSKPEPTGGGMMQAQPKPQVKRPTTPPAPPGLSQFVPSQVTGQPITRAPTTTPSGQMWGQTPWSTQEMLRGYTGWSGYRPFEDIMGHMYAMQPQEPVGARSKYWTPARQY